MKVRFMTVPTLIAALSGSAAAQCQPEFLPAPFGSFSQYGTDMPVDAATTWTPVGSTTPRLVIAGRFNSVAGGSFSRIAMWDGTRWQQLGSGINGNVIDLFDFNGTLVATGQFTSAGGVAAQNIARWNGTSWSAMGSLNSSGFALGMHNGFLFVGGAFTVASGVSANHIARWNTATSAWQAANQGLNGNVNALGNGTVSGASGESLIIGGTFTTANGVAANNIVGFNLTSGQVWHPMGTGTNGAVHAIEKGEGSLGNLYVGGAFTTAGGVATGGFARWNGFSWQANSGNFLGTVYALENYFDQVGNVNRMMVGGFFPGFGGSPSISSYNGSTYTNPGVGGVGASGSVFCMTNYNSSLIVGGAFSNAGNIFTQNLARWSGSQTAGWSDIRPGASAPVRALLPRGTGLFAGGDFTFTINSTETAPHLVLTDGTAEHTVTNCFGCGFVTGTNGPIHALGNYTTGNIFNPTDHLIMGGQFTQAGGLNAANIAQFDMGGYNPMGTGADGVVRCVRQLGTKLIAGGAFTTMGGITCNGLAQWNNVSWAAMGTGLTADGGIRDAHAMTTFNNELIIGGRFASAGGVPATSIVRWNGTSFAALANTALSGTVKALTVFNNQVIAAGDFTSTSGPALDRIAAWDGTNWTPMNAGLPAAALLIPTSLAIHEGELHVGCAPIFAEGPNSVLTIFRWTGSAWTPITGAPRRPVLALASAAGALWAGGDFGVASGRATPFLTQRKCSCYANCDNSTAAPTLNVNDFSCFLNAFAAGETYANCDLSTIAPILNVNDFSCYLNKFAAGCP